MNTTLTQLSPATAVVRQWRQAVGGQIQARGALLDRIMSRRSSRPPAPRYSPHTAG
jgi:hypothetical protein